MASDRLHGELNAPHAWSTTAVTPALAGAVGTAKHRPVRFASVSDDLAAAMAAGRGELVNRALEAVEDVSFAGGDHLERLMIVVAADFTLSHRYLLLRFAGRTVVDGALDWDVMRVGAACQTIS